MYILKIIIYVFLVVFVIASAVVGCLYNKNNKRKHRETEDENSQHFVQDNLDVLGVSNKGTSMDDRKIYLVPFSRMGY